MRVYKNRDISLGIALWKLVCLRRRSKKTRGEKEGIKETPD